MNPRGTFITALILLGLGVERLLSLYLLGSGMEDNPLRFALGVTGVVLGALLLALTGYTRLHARR
jgi:hypothetical protein